ncbi:MAG: PLP-dependent aminotransferase family protein [Cytophagales bacterium]|nr:PLP-dependent aminotransferase family protein [Cytophagales bacterium]
MNNIFSDRISDVPKSFIREILKVAVDEEVISFAGGLPNRDLFPLEELKQASDAVFKHVGPSALQYSSSEGSLKIRKFISARYLQKFNLEIPVEHILITSGSQQGLDLLGKTFLNEGDDIIIEEPGYLGAIQAFSIYKPNFLPITVSDDGLDIDTLNNVLNNREVKLIYSVPNFQNPSGVSYPEKNRKEISETIGHKNVLIIEDDPYGDLRYAGKPGLSFKHLVPERSILLGSFSKTVVPGFRLGWIVADEDIYEKLLIAKQASDLHTNQFAQCVIEEYLAMGNFESHVSSIKEVYGRQRDAMINSIKKYFPSNVRYTQPDGGMFLWVALPHDLSSMKLFNIAIEKKVAFVPGHPFYIGKKETNTLRLNFSNVDESTIETGIQRLGEAIGELLEQNEKSPGNNRGSAV